VAYLAYYLHWPLTDILTLEHADRRRFLREVGEINRRANGDAGGGASAGIPLQNWPES
jgi:hypothetical protein